MSTWVALFRGINVGGNNILPMAELRAELAGLGFDGVRTYIQSGNVVFRSAARSAPKLQELIVATVERSHGFRTPVLVLAAAELERALHENPFPDPGDPKFLHFVLLFEKPKRPNLKELEALASTEEFRLIGRVLYLLTPDGIARSKLATKAEKCLGVGTTARNLRTVEKLVQMAGE